MSIVIVLTFYLFELLLRFWIEDHNNVNVRLIFKIPQRMTWDPRLQTLATLLAKLEYKMSA